MNFKTVQEWNYCFSLGTPVFLRCHDVSRWRHCYADSLKTPKASYMLNKLLCVYRMTKYVGKILL